VSTVGDVQGVRDSETLIVPSRPYGGLS
jgi:hypothetical protein